MTVVGAVHFGASIGSLVVGAAVLALRPKGTRRHRYLGYTFVGLMVTVNATALMIYRLFGGFGPFHVAAIVSSVGIVLGAWSAYRAHQSRLARDLDARAVWVTRHYYWMTWTYVGLMAAFASEAITRLPALRPVFGGGRMFGLAVGAATLVIVGVGSRWIKRSARGSLAPFGANR